MTSLSEFSASLTGIPMNFSQSQSRMFDEPSQYSIPLPSLNDLDETYGNCEDIISKGRNNTVMTNSEKKNLSNEIDRLDSKDHIGILKIIINHTSGNKKFYTVNNYGTYVDLNDLGEKCLWDICYYVKLCLQNQKREREKQKAQKEYLDDQRKLEDKMRRQSKLRLTGRPIPTTNTKMNKSKPDETEVSGLDDDDDEEDMNEFDDDDMTTSVTISQNPMDELDPLESSTKIMRQKDYDDDDDMYGEDDDEEEEDDLIHSMRPTTLDLNINEDTGSLMPEDDDSGGYISD